MAKDDITSSFKIDISDLKKNLAEANKQIKLANATFKAETAGMENWSKSADGVSAKIKQLETTLSAQKSKLESYREQLARQQSAYDENGKRADELRAKLAELTAQGIDPASKEFKDYQNELLQVEKAQAQNQTAIDGLQVSLLNQEATVKSTEKEIGSFSQTLEGLKAAEAEAAEEAERSQSAYGQLQSTIAEQETALSELKQKYAEVAVAEGEDSDAAAELASQISELSAELNSNKATLDNADSAADKFDNTLGDVKENAESAGDGFSVMKGVLADLAATAIKAAVDALKEMAAAAYEAWEAYDSGADIIRKATGATGQQAEELIAVYENISRGVKGSFDDIGTAVGEVNSRFGAVGDDLEELSTQFIKFAKLNGSDVKSSIDNVQSAMAAFGLSADETGAFLDTLNTAAQQTGVSTESLLSSMKSNATALQELGYSASDAALFLANLDKSGVDTSSVMTGLKKALQNAVKDGQPLSEAMAGLEQSIKGAADSTEAMTIASELFGSKAGAAIASAVRDGRLSFEQLGTSVQDFGGSVDQTYESVLSANDMLDLAVQNVKVDVASMVDEFLTVNSGEIQAAFRDLTEGILPAFKALVSGADDAQAQVGNAFGSLVKNIAVKAAEMLPQIMKIGTTIITSLIKGLAQAMPEMLTAVSKALSEVMGALGEMIPDVVSTIIGIVPDVVNALLAAAPELLNGAVQFFRAIIEAIPEILPLIAKAIPDLIRSVSDFLIDGIPMIIDGAVALFTAMVEAVPQVIPIFGTYIPDLVEAIAQLLVDNVPVLLKGAVTLFMAIVKAIPAMTVELAKALADVVNVIITSLADPVLDVFDDLEYNLAQTWGGIGEWVLENIVTPVINALSGMWEELTSGAADAWDSITAVFSTVADFFGTIFGEAWSKVKDVFNAGGQIFEGIKDGISDAFRIIVNGLIQGINNVVSVPFEAINDMLNKIRSVDIMGFKPFENLWGENPLKVPQIPMLARGGVLERGQVGLLEGSGAEAVVPLENNKAWIKAVADQMAADLQVKGMLAANEMSEIKDMLDKMTTAQIALSSGFSKAAERLTDIYNIGGEELSALAAIGEGVSGLGDMGVYLDSKALVGQIVPAMDSALGSRAMLRRRG